MRRRLATSTLGPVLAVVVAGLVAAGCGGDSAEPVGAAPPGKDSGAPGATPPGTDAGPSPGPVLDAAPDGPPGLAPATLKQNRDRLVDTLAARKGVARCALWTSLTPTQVGVFVTITDLLGKRSFMTNDPPGGAKRTAAIELMTALDHVTRVYEVRDKGASGNGGGDNNRIWIQVDAALAGALRAFASGLPEWEKSSDLAGPHDPFDATSETVNGQPRGQAHFWSADAKSKPLTRPGVEGIDDPRIVEIDIDYNILHDSNPLGSYFAGLGNKTGLELYVEKWTPLGVGGDPELGYTPTGCTP